MNKKNIILIIFVAVLFLFIILFSWNYFKPQMNMELSISPIEATNLSKLILTIESNKNMQNVSGEIALPENLHLVEGNLKWKTDLQKNEPAKIIVTIISTEDGIGIVVASLDDNNFNTSIWIEGRDRKVYMTSFSKSHEEIVKELEGRIKDPYWIEKYYQICFDGPCYTPEPLKGKELNDYFKSLSLIEDPVYVMMQFDTLNAKPNQEQVGILGNEGIGLFEYHGGYTYYAKVPKNFLEEKYYDFIRWIGIKNPWAKIPKILRNKINQNCSGVIDLNIIFYEKLSDKQFEKLKQVSNGCLAGYKQDCNSTSNDELIHLRIEVTKVEEVASLDFVEKMEIPGRACTLGGPGSWECLPYNPFENLTCENNSFEKQQYEIQEISCKNLSDKLKTELLGMRWVKTGVEGCNISVCETCGCGCILIQWISTDLIINKQYVCYNEHYLIQGRNISIFCENINFRKINDYI